MKTQPALPFLTALALLACAAAPVTAEDLPTYGGDNARTSATVDEAGFPLRPIWSSSAPAAPKLAWPSAEGRVIEGKAIRHRVRLTLMKTRM